MRIFNSTVSQVFVACLLLAIGGCSEEMNELEQWVSETKLKYKGEVEALPAIEPYRAFSYDASILSDPFVIEEYAAERSSDGPKPDGTRRKDPLEFFPLDTLKMVGTLQQNNVTWGLIRDTEGTIHRVQPGNYAGGNDGKIVSVSETEINISELIPDGLGAWVNRAASLSLGYEE